MEFSGDFVSELNKITLNRESLNKNFNKLTISRNFLKYKARSNTTERERIPKINNLIEPKTKLMQIVGRPLNHSVENIKPVKLLKKSDPYLVD